MEFMVVAVIATGDKYTASDSLLRTGQPPTVTEQLFIGQFGNASCRAC
jgi:hypothetical protein